MMKNPFKKKFNIGKKPKIAQPKSPVKFPFSQPGMKGNNDDNDFKPPEVKKTMIGRQPDLPYKPEMKNDTLICPVCQYPLRIEPSSSSPCPNCGFMGTGGQHDTVSDSKKTRSITDLDLNTGQKLSSFRFKLISESKGHEFKIESDENEIVLNRDHLDPENATISSKEHVCARFRDGKIFFQDVSTNGSTFIQVKDKINLMPETKIVMGNRIFLFSGGEPAKDSPSGKVTQQIRMVGNDTGGTGNFVLIDENSGRKILLNQGLNILNRSNLDPGNNSISGSRHATLEFMEGIWILTDFSSNEATFVQCRNEYLMTDKTRVIIGNIIFRFEFE
ncbi:MAG TPA: hypothetical protein DDW27_20200 [Bacteroidales bacterium]|nr:hypothetical protein [Bacteroidales bacterium]